MRTFYQGVGQRKLFPRGLTNADFLPGGWPTRTFFSMRMKVAEFSLEKINWNFTIPVNLKMSEIKVGEVMPTVEPESKWMMGPMELVKLRETDIPRSRYPISCGRCGTFRDKEGKLVLVQIDENGKVDRILHEMSCGSGIWHAYFSRVITVVDDKTKKRKFDSDEKHPDRPKITLEMVATWRKEAQDKRSHEIKIKAVQALNRLEEETKRTGSDLFISVDNAHQIIDYLEKGGYVDKGTLIPGSHENGDEDNTTMGFQSID